jgi:CBS domain-containing protein
MTACPQPTARGAQVKRFVRHILNDKGYEVFSVSPETDVLEALKTMADLNIGALLVIEDGRIVGIFSERDYARKVALMGLKSADTQVRQIMTSVVAFVDPDTSIEEVMALMTRDRIRHVPVLESDELVGLISIGDVVNEVISHQEFTIRQLENYITGMH